MKLSTRIRYSTRLMEELAFHYGEKPVLLKNISSSQEISLKYLAQLIIPLKIAGLINASRGAHGGYTLAKHPKDIKLSEIMSAVEGSLNLVECVDNETICSRSSTCASREVWIEISNRFVESLDSYTLQNIIERQKDRK